MPLHQAACPAVARLLLAAATAPSTAAPAAAARSPLRMAMQAPGRARLQPRAAAGTLKTKCPASPAADGKCDLPASPVTAAAAAVARHAGKRQRLEEAWLAKVAPGTPPRAEAPQVRLQPQSPPQPRLPAPPLRAAEQAQLRAASPAQPLLPDPLLQRAMVPGEAVPCTAAAAAVSAADYPAPIRPASIRPTSGCATLPAFQMCGAAAAMQSLSLLADIPADVYRHHSGVRA